MSVPKLFWLVPYCQKFVFFQNSCCYNVAFNIFAQIAFCTCEKIFEGKKISESSRKQNWDLPCPGDYLYSIYIIFITLLKIPNAR